MGSRKTEQQHGRHLNGHAPLGHCLGSNQSQHGNGKARDRPNGNEGGQARKSLQFNKSLCSHSANQGDDQEEQEPSLPPGTVSFGDSRLDDRVPNYVFLHSERFEHEPRDRVGEIQKRRADPVVPWRWVERPAGDEKLWFVLLGCSFR